MAKKGKLTPMMQQYMQIKEENKDCILFYRLGDFYEMFFDDALTASKELEITLTGKNCGLEERAPMCGVPYHAVDSYLNKLVEKGYKVGICEQVEDPSQAKGIVKREIVRIVTPGTNISQQSLDDEKNNYLMCIFANDGSYGISFVDVTTGDFRTTSMDSLAKVRDEIFKFEPAEIVCNDAFLISGMDFDYLKDKMSIVISSIEPYHFDEEQAEERIKRQFKVGNLEGLGLLDHPMGVIATGALLGYLHETQKSSLDHLMHIEAYETSEFMIIDSSSRRNLELCETLRDKQKKGSLLWVLDKTKTAMGARMLRNMVEQPLVDKKKIEERYDAITTLTDQTIVREELREYLNPIYDLERLMTKVSYKTANPRDMIAFKTSLELLPAIKTVLEECKDPLLSGLREDLDPLEDIHNLLEDSIIEEPPLAIKEGGIIKEGFKDDIDQNDLNYLGTYDFVHSTTQEAELYGKWQFTPSQNILLGTTYQNIDGDVISWGSPYAADVDSQGYYLQHQYNANGLNTQAGIRVEDNEKYGTHTIGQIAARYQLFPLTSIYTNIGTAFRSPTLNELYSAYGNPDLKPEESTSYEIGLDQNLNHGFSTGISLYRTEVENLIDATSVTGYIFQNIDQATFEGSEIYLKWQGENLYVNVGYNYVRAKNDKTDEDLSRRPRQNATLTTGWQDSKFGFSTTLMASSSYDNSAYDDITVPGHLRVDMNGYYNLSNAIKVFANIQNVGDSNYRTAYGSGSYYMNGGRLASAGVTFRY